MVNTELKEVYVVQSEWRIEDGNYFIGIFSSKEKAIALMEKRNETRWMVAKCVVNGDYKPTEDFTTDSCNWEILINDKFKPTPLDPYSQFICDSITEEKGELNNG